MNDRRIASARRALQNASSALDLGHPIVAEQWAGSAAMILREANVSEAEQRQLIAPRDRSRTGDRVVLALSVFVIVWMLADWLGSVL